MPVEDRSSMMALSLNVGQPSRIISICSSVKVSFMTDIVLTRLILRTGLLTIYSSSSSQEKKVDIILRMLSRVTLLGFLRS